MIKLSVTSKLDGIKSWSLNALDTCPASKLKNGQLVDACKGCYATTGNYRSPNVKAPREHNKEDWKRKSWVDDMVKALSNDRFFRWFDSGDMYSIKLAIKIYQVMELTPWVNHWIPTRMAKFNKFKIIIDKMQQLENVMVRFSSDNIDGSLSDSANGSIIIANSSQNHSNAFECKAYENDGKCNGCRACYSKDVPLVAYKAHGVKMNKVIRLLQVA